MASGKEKFDLKTVHENFSSALTEDDDVKLQLYLESYEELNKFFNLLGSIFGFVSSDLVEKMGILQEFLKDESVAENYSSVRTMIEYEKERQLLAKAGFTSGSRTLLRLHRGLDFIRDFLRNVSELKDHENTSAACRQSYDRTLAKHHPFIVKNAARIAMYTLPNREELLKRVCGTQEEINKALKLLPQTLETTAVIYNRIDTLYTQHNLHSLP